ncbi:MAG: glycosyltransferase [Candidatus Omnitrophica bacterium]|nr:glycosyltransferase [Candidatus Omnitrophota bacterium]
MLKIAVILVTHKRIEIIGGIERMIELLYDKLRKLGTPVYLVSRDPLKISKVIHTEEREMLWKVKQRNYGSIKVLRFNLPELIGVISELLFSCVAMLRVMSIVKRCRKRGDEIVIHAMDTVYGGLAGFLASKLLNVPYIAHTHGVRAYFMYTTSKQSVVRTIDFLVERTVIKNGKRLLSVNNEARIFWIKNGIPPEKIIIVPVFVETKRFSPNPFYRKLERKRYGIDDETLVFGFIGRLSPEKNVEYLIKGFSLAKLDRAKLLIIGDGPLFSFLKQRVQSEGITDKVLFTGFWSSLRFWSY